MNNNLNRIAQNTGFLFIRMLLVLLVGLYTSRLVLKSLGIEDFGIYNVIGSIIIFFSFFKNALTNATYRFFAFELGKNNPDNLKKIYSMSINCHIILASILFICIEICGIWFINQRMNINPERLYAANFVLQFSLLTFVCEIIRTPFNSCIIAYEKMNYFAIISIVEIIMKLGIAFILINSNTDRLILYSILMFITSLIMLGIYITYCKNKFKECKYFPYWDKTILKQYSQYSGYSILVNTADVCTAQSYSIFFNLFLGVIYNAALGIANQVNAQVNSFLSSFTQAFTPQIIKSYASKNFDYFLKLIVSTSKISYFLFFLVSMPIILNTEFILKIWLSNYPPITANFIRIVICYSLIDSCQVSLWQAVHATGNIKTHQILMSVIKFLAIPLIFITLKLGYSANIALSIWVFFNLICAIVRTIYMRYLINLQLSLYIKNTILPIILITCLSLPIPFFLCFYINNEIYQFFISSIIFELSAIFIIYNYGLNNQERNTIKNIIGKYINKTNQRK